jgi:hypothetical protein
MRWRSSHRLNVGKPANGTQKTTLCCYRGLIKPIVRLRISSLQLMLTVRLCSVGLWFKGLPIAVGEPFSVIGSSHIGAPLLIALKFLYQSRQPLQQPCRKPWNPLIWNGNLGRRP